MTAHKPDAPDSPIASAARLYWRAMSSASQPAPSPQLAKVPVQAIVALAGKGMTAREILEAFPSLKPEDIRAALLQAVEVVCDRAASLTTSADEALAILQRARRNAGLSEAEATRLGVEETRAHRREKAAQRLARVEHALIVQRQPPHRTLWAPAAGYPACAARWRWRGR